MEIKKVCLQRKQKVSYETICNEPIHPSVPKNDILFKFKILKIMPFKGKEDPKEHLRRFKHLSYVIADDDVLML